MIGLVTILALATGAIVLWFATPTHASRYAGESGGVRVLVSVTFAATERGERSERKRGSVEPVARPPEHVTCDVSGVKIDAHRLP